MTFEFTALRNFRSFREFRAAWGAGLNLVLGPNGAGKTNLLESLSILAGWGPFAGRAGRTVAWDAPGGRALLKARAAGEEGHEIEVLLSSRMTIRAEGKRVRCTDVRLMIPSIAFLPTDINLIDGSPAARRLFVDKLCALYHPPYARRLAEFHQISRHRAALLRQGRPVRGTTLPFARLGGWVMEARRHVVSRLAALLTGAGWGADHFVHSHFTNFTFSLSMTPALECGGAEYLLGVLEETAQRELHALRPLVGPGRDDLNILTNGRPAADALSRGQKRRLVLSLILTAGRLMEARLKKTPVLLFDDLAAELDAEGRRTAGEVLLNTGWQVFVTGTDNPFPGLGDAPHILQLA